MSLMRQKNTRYLSMKTVKELIEYLQQFPSNTKIRKTGWDCYNDEPYEGEVKPYTLETKSGKIKGVYF